MNLVAPKSPNTTDASFVTTGDGLLVEFASVVDAVESANTIQRAMAKREADIPEDPHN